MGTLPKHSSFLTRLLPLHMWDQAEGSDEKLIRAAQADPQAFDALYRRYVGCIYAYLYSFTYDASEAEDLTSQTFFSAWKGLKRYREQGTFAAWLFRIARNKAHDLHRQRHPHIPLETSEDLPMEADQAIRFDKRETLGRAAQLID